MGKKKCNDREYNDNNYNDERNEGCRDIQVGVRFIREGLEDIEEGHVREGVRDIKKGLHEIKEGSRDLGCEY